MNPAGSGADRRQNLGAGVHSKPDGQLCGPLVSIMVISGPCSAGFKSPAIWPRFPEKRHSPFSPSAGMVILVVQGISTLKCFRSTHGLSLKISRRSSILSL